MPSRCRSSPSNQSGDDTHMLSNVRVGAIQMMDRRQYPGHAGADVPRSTMSASIFKDAKTAWAALDGSVGDIVRADIQKTGLQPMHAVWDEGFRQITSSTRPINTLDDLHGFKIRVPPSPISLSLFKDLGAAPTTLNVAEL